MLYAEGNAVDSSTIRNLGFGGYITRRQHRRMFSRRYVHSAVSDRLPRGRRSDDGELFAAGEIAATKALFPGLKVPFASPATTYSSISRYRPRI